MWCAELIRENLVLHVLVMIKIGKARKTKGWSDQYFGTQEGPKGESCGILEHQWWRQELFYGFLVIKNQSCEEKETEEQLHH